MTKPTKIRSGGTVYLSEAIATDKTTKKVEYMGESYYAEKLPAEYVMLEGVAYKRLMSVADYNKKAVMEGSAPIKPAKKIRIKGTDTVLEAVNVDDDLATDISGIKDEDIDASNRQYVEIIEDVLTKLNSLPFMSEEGVMDNSPDNVARKDAMARAITAVYQLKDVI